LGIIQFEKDVGTRQAIEVLDACLAYISLEMSEEQIFRRMLLNLSGLNFRTFVFGSQEQKIIDNDGH
jgi:replicative DNA helicase